MAAYYLAVDIGACSGRHIIGHMDNGKMVLEEIYRFENGMVKKDGELCCLTLIKADNLAESIRAFLGPLMGGVVDGGGPETPVEDSENETGRA